MHSAAAASALPDHTPDVLSGVVRLGEVLAGKYRIDRVLGVGGMGVVVQAQHLIVDEPVAIKFLSPGLASNDEAVARFEREARAAFKIRSEHVARVGDVDKTPGGIPFMVMEHLEGRDLSALLTHGRRLPIDTAVDYILQAADAVAAAHAEGIIHRDLKPENLFLTRRADGEPFIKVLDFGLSKVVDSGSGPRQRALTAVNQTMGSPNYMSPEQWQSTRSVGPAADQWALATILYELLTGAQAFPGDQMAPLCQAILTRSPAPMCSLRPGLPAQLDNIVGKALQKKPDQRYRTIAELAEALGPFGPPDAAAYVRRIAVRFSAASPAATATPPVADSGRAAAPRQPSWLQSRLAAASRWHFALVIGALVLLLGYTFVALILAGVIGTSPSEATEVRPTAAASAYALPPVAEDPPDEAKDPPDAAPTATAGPSAKAPRSGSGLVPQAPAKKINPDDFNWGRY